MSQQTIQSAVGQWVARDPGSARVFESLGIDYCCGGKKPLEEACRERRLDTCDVLQQLDAATSAHEDEDQDWSHAPLTELCDNIERTHHAFLRQELPRLTAMIAQVVQEHGYRHPELATLQRVFRLLRSELEPHMQKEERILFPAIRLLENSPAPPQFPFGSLDNPIHVMESEHASAGECLAKIRELTSDYLVPGDACNTYRVLLESLRALEADMHQHVHKENNILFPRAALLEAHIASPSARPVIA
jgi:regulator of cell morphogenesis and NO signaling